MSRSERVSTPEKAEPITLQYLARLAGVHPMTVSNALKGTGRVAPATRQKIQELARQYDYKPNMMARALVTGRTHVIAVVTGTLEEQFYSHLLHLLERELTATNYNLLVLRNNDEDEDLLSAIKSSSVDGIIAIDVFPKLRGMLQLSGGFVAPCVYAGVLDPLLASSFNIDNVAIDLSASVVQAIELMLEAGRQRVAYLASNAGMAYTEGRGQVFRATLEAAGRSPEIIDVNIGVSTANRALVRSRLKEYIQAHGCPDGLLCQNDEMAIAAYRALRDLNYRIPEDVLLVGCDGLADMEYFDPPLSTIAQPANEMCAIAWRFLQQRMANPTMPAQHAALSAQLVMRPSLQP